MRKTIKQLEDEVFYAKKSKDEFYTNWQESKKKLEKIESEYRYNSESLINMSRDMLHTLKEIIRWQVNPETAMESKVMERIEKHNRLNN